MERLGLILRKCWVAKRTSSVDFLYEIKVELMIDVVMPIRDVPFSAKCPDYVHTVGEPPKVRIQSRASLFRPGIHSDTLRGCGVSTGGVQQKTHRVWILPEVNGSPPRSN